jgi:hypothetical protein
MIEQQPNRLPIPDPQHAQHEGGKGVPGLPIITPERAKPPPESGALPTLPLKSALNRAVERSRTHYERNQWVFLPLGEAGKDSPTLPSRPPTTVFSATSAGHLLEEPKSSDNNQPSQEAGEDLPNLPQPHKEPISLLDPIARILGKALEREYPNPEERIRFIRRIAAMRPSPELNEMMRRAGIPPEQLSPDAEAILRIFGPLYDKTANDDKH